MEGARRDDLHILFANYLRAKIADGSFPKGCLLPVREFMMVFRLSLPDALKACFDLERCNLARSLGNAGFEVVAGKTSDKFESLDVGEDVARSFKSFAKLELLALENAWPRIDRSVVQELFIQGRELEPSKRIWLMNDALHAQIADNCDAPDLKLGIASLRFKLDFFRRLYLDSVPLSETLEHAILIEAIVHAICLDDLSDAKTRVGAYFAKLERTLAGFFKDMGVLPCRRACACKNV